MRLGSGLIIGVIAIVLVLVGGSIGLTAAVVGRPNSTTSTTAPPNPIQNALHQGTGGQASITALTTGWLTAVDDERGAALGDYLCGGSSSATSATGNSWVFITLAEQPEPGTPTQTSAATATWQLHVEMAGQDVGDYLAALTHGPQGWCIATISSDDAGGGGSGG